VFTIDEVGTDELMDFSPEQKHTAFLQRKYTEMGINTTTEKISAESVRIDDRGSVEV